MSLLKPSYLRSTMKQSGLNHLMILSAYKNQLDQLDPTKIASDFANKNDAHKHFLVNVISGLLQCTLHGLNFLWFDFFDVKRIQNVTLFLRTFYVCYHDKIL